MNDDDLIVYLVNIVVFVVVFLFCIKSAHAFWQYKAPCNPYTTAETTNVVPGYFYNISGQCVVNGDPDPKTLPSPHEYNDHGMIFYNGYFPKWDNPPAPGYYSNQIYSNETNLNNRSNQTNDMNQNNYNNQYNFNRRHH